MSANITTINPPSFGPPVAPYSQGVLAGGLIFVAGQVALDAHNAVIAPGDARAQTVAALERVQAVLAEHGGSLEDVVSATVFLADLAHFADFNAGWSEMFGEHRPARATLRSELLLEGLVVEIQAIAIHGQARQ